MAKAEFIRARVDETLKANVEVLFSRLGLSMTEAITLFLTQCDIQQGLPFEIRMPNKKTKQALDEAHAGVGIIKHDTVEDMFNSWGE